MVPLMTNIATPTSLRVVKGRLPSGKTSNFASWGLSTNKTAKKVRLDLGGIIEMEKTSLT